MMQCFVKRWPLYCHQRSITDDGNSVYVYNNDFNHVHFLNSIIVKTDTPNIQRYLLLKVSVFPDSIHMQSILSFPHSIQLFWTQLIFQGLHANIPLFITTFYLRLPDLPGPLLYNQLLHNIYLKQFLFSSDIITAFFEDLLMVVKLCIKNKIHLTSKNY